MADFLSHESHARTRFNTVVVLRNFTAGYFLYLVTALLNYFWLRENEENESVRVWSMARGINFF